MKAVTIERAHANEYAGVITYAPGRQAAWCAEAKLAQRRMVVTFAGGNHPNWYADTVSLAVPLSDAIILALREHYDLRSPGTAGGRA